MIIPLRTIYRNLKKIKKTGDVKHRGGNGRISKITQKAAREIGQYIRRKPTITTKFIAAKLEDVGVNVSCSTVSRYLTSHGYKNALPLATPMLTPAHKHKRIEWAQNHMNDDWQNTLFSHHLLPIYLRPYSELKNIYEIDSERTWLEQKENIITKLLPPLYKLVMRQLSSYSATQGIMDGKFYTKILERQIPEVYSMLGDSWRLQQDNDPKHTSRVAKEFLKNNVPERNTELRRPKNLNELDVFLHEEWVKIPNNLLINLVNSMPQRCREVIDRNGERIPY
ncbi:IS630 family transposase [Rhizophagus irregularis DAOM 181602=DAOM 197198]|nr:IS630 family transposase [Rhizophagus irregularis DAOM 181602=DAOM 197198]